MMALVFADFRNSVGVAGGVLLDPLVGFDGAIPVLTIALAGLLSTLLSTTLRHYFTDWVNLARITKKQSALQKEITQALRKGNQSRVEKLQEFRQSMVQDSFNVQGAQMKSMAITMFLVIVIFSWLGTFVGAVLINRTFSVPWSRTVDMTDHYVIPLFPGWILLYSLLAIPIGVTFPQVLKYFSFKKRLSAMGHP